MKTLLHPTLILVLFALVVCADKAITSAMVHSYIRAFCYGIVALLALIYVVLALI